MEQLQQLNQIGSIRKKHPPAVPFLWEERPGTPKRDWKPNSTTAAIPPLKLMASVPFEWEELPGKPLSCFPNPREHIEQRILPVLPPPSYSEDIIPLLLEDHENDYYGLPSQTEESTFCSDKPTESDHPVDWTSSPSSPESESAAAGGASLVGVSLLERLFPLLSSHQGGLRQNAGSSYSEMMRMSNAITKPEEEEEEEKAGGESKPCVSVRRIHTLGELIMMSRRISRKRKTGIQVQKQGISMEMIEKSDICMGIGGCMFGVIDNRNNWNWNWNWKNKTHFHQLKFM